MPRRPKISIIIPARNEVNTISSVLRSLARQELISDAEVLVIDGSSTDKTGEVALGFPFVRVVRSEAGLALQMNRGAQEAAAPVLWYLHADSTLPDRTHINRILEAIDFGAMGGTFLFRLRGDDAYYSFVNWFVNFRARVLKRPYGDQGIFVRTDVFERLGGFREMKSCEDLEFTLRLRRAGKFEIIGLPVETSARTWQTYGKLQTTVYHLAEWLRFEFWRSTGGAAKVPFAGGFTPRREPEMVVLKTTSAPPPAASVETPVDDVKENVASDSDLYAINDDLTAPPQSGVAGTPALPSSGASVQSPPAN